MYARIGRPHTSCMALGRFDFIRVDFPAARMMAVVLIGARGQGRGARAADEHSLAPCPLPLAPENKATRLGFEPRRTGPKPVVLPLHYRVVATDVGGICAAHYTRRKRGCWTGLAYPFGFR